MTFIPEGGMLPEPRSQSWDVTKTPHPLELAEKHWADAKITEREARHALRDAEQRLLSARRSRISAYREYLRLRDGSDR